jgi:NAD+ synthase
MRGRGSDIAEWIAGRVTLAGAKGIVVGLSGGVDSAVVARLAQLATDGRTIGVIMPCHSDPQDEADARLVADRLALPTLRVDLEPTYDRMVRDLRGGLEMLPHDQSPSPVDDDIRARVPIANIKPRLRMTTLYFLANTLDYLVAGTGNRSELTIGYFTKFGDGSADLLPIGHLLKSEVCALARELDIPERVIAKPPSAGLWLGQTDEAEMGFTYSDLERYLTTGPEAVAPALALRIERLIRASDHKRALPPMPETRNFER